MNTLTGWTSFLTANHIQFTVETGANGITCLTLIEGDNVSLVYANANVYFNAEGVMEVVEVSDM